MKCYSSAGGMCILPCEVVEAMRQRSLQWCLWSIFSSSPFVAGYSILGRVCCSKDSCDALQQLVLIADWTLQFSPDTCQRPIKGFALKILPPVGTRVLCFREPPGSLLKGSVCGEAAELSRAVLPSPDQSWRFPGREQGLQPLPCQEGQRTRDIF